MAQVVEVLRYKRSDR